MRRFIFIFSSIAALAAILACAHTEGDLSSAPSLPDAGRDAGGDASLSGSVCGDRTGLEEGTGWPNVGGCAKRGGYVETSGPLTPAIADVAATSTLLEPVVRKDGAVIYVDGSALVVARGGQLIERLETGHAITYAPVLLEDARALVVLDERTLALFDRRKATLITATQADAGSDASSDAGADASSDASTDAAAPSPVAADWRYDFDAPISSPTFARGHVYVTTADGRLLAIGLRSAALAWTVALGSESGLPVAVASTGKIIAVTRAGSLSFVDGAGARTRTIEIGAPVTTHPTLAKDDAVCLGDTHGHVHVLTESAVIADVDTGDPIGGACAHAADGTVYVPSGKKVVGVNRQGKIVLSYATLGDVAPPVLGSNQVIYFGSADAHVYAVAADGLLVWATNVRSAITLQSALGPGRALHLVTRRGLSTIGP